jgi:hypothetical protein
LKGAARKQSAISNWQSAKATGAAGRQRLFAYMYFVAFVAFVFFAVSFS